MATVRPSPPSHCLHESRRLRPLNPRCGIRDGRRQAVGDGMTLRVTTDPAVEKDEELAAVRPARQEGSGHPLTLVLPCRLVPQKNPLVLPAVAQILARR